MPLYECANLLYALLYIFIIVCHFSLVAYVCTLLFQEFESRLRGRGVSFSGGPVTASVIRRPDSEQMFAADDVN